ncbi:MAG TPA: transcriptional repressor LexA [Ktedonobacterales bacterium]
MKREMSDIQTRILAFIEEYTRTHGRPPTNREIGAKVEISSTGHVDYHLTVLEKKGYIERERKKSRGIRLAHQEPAGLRVYGAIAAGQPIEIYADQQESPLDLSARHTHEYVLKVKGNSMIDDHINDGDCVLVLPDATISDGDIIVATHMTDGANGAATLKRIYRERDRIRLQPANSQMDPIYVPRHEWDTEWQVQGKVTAVYRQFS